MPASTSLIDLDARSLADAIARREVSAAAAVEAVLARIAAREPEVRAWTHLDPEHALEAARRLDAHQATGAPLGPLHGVPVGLKDIIDTADYPTENGTVLDAGRRPVADAVVAARLRAAGAVILGKTVTTELAVFHPGRTRNPHNPEHTPGGSSSGSAAAVAAAMVPLAVGTQTNGSMIRPAAFCGVVGFKPSRGTIPRGGVLNQSQTLDQIGVFARSAADAAFAADVLSGPDASDPATAGRLKGGLRAIAEAGPPVPPRFAFVRTPVWDHAEAETRAGLESLVGALGDSAEEVELPEAFARVHGWHRAINMAEIAANYDRYYERGRDRLSAILLGMIEEGRGVLARDYLHALAGIGRLNAVLAETLAGFDAVLTPSAPGPAPKGLEATGNPTFCTIWSYLGVPAVSLPLLRSPGGLPIGVQLVGAAGDDARLLRTAGWLERFAGSAGT